jgi:hypothetical protein
VRCRITQWNLAGFGLNAVFDARALQFQAHRQCGPGTHLRLVATAPAMSSRRLRAAASSVNLVLMGEPPFGSGLPFVAGTSFSL